MTGAYKRHFKLVHRDWHDWDVASTPSLFETAGGKKLLVLTPKDGHLYGIDLADNKIVFRVPVTKIENVDAPFSPNTEVRFCPAQPAERSGAGRPTIRRPTSSSRARPSGARP